MQLRLFIVTFKRGWHKNYFVMCVIIGAVKINVSCEDLRLTMNYFDVG